MRKRNDITESNTSTSRHASLKAYDMLVCRGMKNHKPVMRVCDDHKKEYCISYN